MAVPNSGEAYILDCFQACLIGRLVRGIIHNINGPIQILSMQVEMLKMEFEKDSRTMESFADSNLHESIKQPLRQLSENMRKRYERLAQMEDVLSRIENMVGIIAKRNNEETSGKKPVVFNEIIREEVEFGSSDLFFKHNVKQEIDLPDDSSLVLRCDLDGYLLENLQCFLCCKPVA
ncbi:MAG TPA: hypothetical protein EYP57_10270, partial [Thermodesulfobacteriaceae bacterium]|nr:hypothetical protein [Thermodesulfobacteriaceae bacterium]